MTVLHGDTGRVSFGTFKETTINYPSTMQQMVGMGLVLPTSEPATPQITYTVQASDIPTFSGHTPFSYDIVPLLYACGKNSTVSTTINFRMKINDVSINNGNNSSQTANFFYTYTVSRYAPVQVGDVVSFSLWSTQSDVTLDYSCFTTAVTRMQLAPMGAILKDVKFAVGVAYPTPTAQAPTPTFPASTQPFLTLPSTNGVSAINTVVSSSVQHTMYALIQDPLYKIGRCSYGDSINSITIAINATNKFTYYRNWMPTTISFREIYV